MAKKKTPNTSKTAKRKSAEGKPRRKPAKDKSSGREKAPRQQKTAPADDDRPGFPIVGVGASAGGLEALQRLLEAMPDKPGVALVIIQHLDPNKESLTPELLARRTKLEVTQVHDDPHVKPNRVYCIPPGKYLSIADGTLHLSEPDRPRGARMAIDFFLRSLAADQQQCAVGIVLSGTGTDGTLGVKAVKGAGGLVIAQDPTSAEHGGMPRSAIGSNAVDHILRPEEIAEVLVRYAQHAYVRQRGGPADDQPVDERERGERDAEHAEWEQDRDGLAAVIALLRAHTRHDFRNYKEKTLVRRTRRRMCLHHLDTYEDYLAHLRQHPAEIEALAGDLLIAVTDFFREPEAWEALRELAIRPLVEAKEDDEPIRVWTPGCATGEEPYSMAMLVLEELQAAKKSCPLHLFASDVDKDAIEFARTGRYPRTIEADVSPERLQRFFSAADGDDHYQVNKLLRETVVFAEQDLLADPPFSKLDVLCCRNLLIYLKPEVQEKIIALFHFALHEGGTLFLGSAETIGRQTDLFQTVHKKWRIFRRAGPTRHDRVDIPISTFERRRDVELSAPSPQRREAHLSHVVQTRLLDMLAPAAVLINSDWRILYISGDVDNYFTHRAGAPSDDVLQKARQGLTSKLRGAVHTALSENRTVSVTARVRRGSSYVPVALTVRVLHDPQLHEDLALVIFDEEDGRQETAANKQQAAPRRAEAGGQPAQGSDDGDVNDQLVIRQLEEELAETKDSLQAAIEQLEGSNEEYRAANEEVMSINEELQSTNEEIETSKEELQSLNEELSTVNGQLAAKVDELETKHADLENLLAVTNVATIFLDTELAVRFFTPSAQNVIRLRAADRGRALADLSHDFKNNDLPEVAQRVLDKLTPAEDEVTCEDGRVYLRRVTPYRTDDHRIGGVVITFVDISEQKTAANALADAKDMAEKIFDTVREAMLVLDTDLRVVSANESFYRSFQVGPQDTEGRLVYELGNNQWDIPELRRLLEEVLPTNKTFNDFEVTHEFESIGTRIMLLNGRRIDHIQRILLAVEDVTERQAAARALRESEARLAEELAAMQELHELSTRLLACEGAPEALQEVLGAVISVLHGARGNVQLYDPDSATLEIVAQQGFDEKFLERFARVTADDPSACGRALRERRRVIVEDVEADEKYAPLREAAAQAGYRAVQSTPLINRQGDVLGMISTHFTEPHQPNERELRMLDLYARLAADFLDDVRDQQALHESEERVRLATEGAGIGIWDWNLETNEATWNAIEAELLGVEADRTVDAFFQRIHADDVEAVRAAIDRGIAEGTLYESEFRVVLPDGQIRWLVGRGEVFRDAGGKPVRMMGVNYDISARKHLEAEIQQMNDWLEDQVEQRTEMLRMLQDVTRSANEARTVEDAVLAALARICQYNGWQVGHVWWRAEDGSQRFVSGNIWHLSDKAHDAIAQLEEFQRICEQTQFEWGQPVIGMVAQTGQPFWIDEIAEHATWSRGDARELGLHAVIAFPITIAGQVVAVLEFFSDHPVKREERFMEIMPDVGIQLGHVIYRKRLERQNANAVEREQRRIGRDIHDGIGQELTGLRHLVQGCAEALKREGSQEAGAVQRIMAGLGTVHRELRGIVRDLVPVEIDTGGLIAALETLAERTRTNDPVECSFECPDPVAIDNNILATHVFRIAQEAVSNAVNHAGAEHVRIRLKGEDGELHLQVVDNGSGIDEEALTRGGFGLRNMAFRTEVLGGRISIRRREQGGTVVDCTVPLRPAQRGEERK
ncbi:MAG: PAS domain S-box protein [Planctomycetota bacterium]|nr:MAG: PAS domain S-box protein [Planctomycetota bacterium]